MRAGTSRASAEFVPAASKEHVMDSIIYLVGLVVIVMFVLGALGLR